MSDSKAYAFFYFNMSLFGEVLLYVSVSECLLQEKKQAHILFWWNWSTPSYSKQSGTYLNLIIKLN